LTFLGLVLDRKKVVIIIILLSCGLKSKIFHKH
jgi:hypothetical protein